MLSSATRADSSEPRSILYRGCSLFLGCVLVLAALLKLHHHWTRPSLGQELLDNPWLLLVAIMVELGLGIWLLSGLHPRPARWSAMVLFAIFAVVSLRQVLVGEVSCGCFGNASIRPLWIFFFDVLAVLALWMARPIHMPTIRSHPARFAVALTVGLAVGIVGGIALVRYGTPPLVASPAVLDLGEVPAGGAASGIVCLTNPKSGSIRVAGIQTTCDCLTIKLSNDILGPAERVEATATLDLKTKPTFRGRLRVEAVGEGLNGRPVFVMQVLVHVIP